MNQEAIQNLVRFALAAAARMDHPVDLGPIHLLKLLYLADWAHAQRHNGETFTGIPWRFYHFGPYCADVVAELERAVPSCGVVDRSFFGAKSGREVRRWVAERDEATDEAYSELERVLPTEVAIAIRRTVQSHGGDTYPLLHQVYGTPPMRRSAPGELIDFSAAVREMLEALDGSSPEAPPRVLQQVDPTLSTTQRKKRERAFNDLRQRMKEALSRSDEAGELVYIEPVEDEVYEQGVNWLESQADQIHPVTATFLVHQSVWHSRTRRSVL